jgi:hypothetical protein
VNVNDDVEQAQNHREVDKLTLVHLQRSRQMTYKMINLGISMDKANVRGLDLSNGIMCVPTNEACELLPQALLCSK